MTPRRPQIVQLAVPVVAALGGVLLLGEHVTSRLALVTCAILGGIALATSRPKPRPAPPADTGRGGRSRSHSA